MSRIGHVQRLKLQSYDNKIFEVDRKVACVSKLIQEFVEEPHTKVVATEVKITIDIIEDTTREHAPIVYLPRVDGETLWEVLEYSKAYVEGAKNASSAHKNDEEEEKMVPWEIESFFNMDQVTFTSLLRAGAYLQTKGLVALACRAAVYMADRGMAFDKGEESTGLSNTIWVLECTGNEICF